MFTLPQPDPFNGHTFSTQLDAAGLGGLGWAAEMDGGLIFDCDEALRPRLVALLAAHDGRPTPPPPTAEERIAELESQVAALVAEAAPPSTTTAPTATTPPASGGALTASAARSARAAGSLPR